MTFHKVPTGDLKKKRKRSKKPEMVVTSEKLGPPIEEHLVDPLEGLELVASGSVEPSSADLRTVLGINHSQDLRVAWVPMERRRAIYDIGPDDPVWNGNCWLSGAEGEILRFRPPANPAVDPRSVVAEYEALGCAVRLAPAEVADAVVPREVRQRIKTTTKRDLVLELVAKSAGDDAEREQLGSLCEEVLARVGL